MTQKLSVYMVRAKDVPRTQLLTTGVCAKALGVSPRTVQKIIDSGRLGGVRCGWERRVKPADLVAYCRRHGYDVPDWLSPEAHFALAPGAAPPFRAYQSPATLGAALAGATLVGSLVACDDWGLATALDVAVCCKELHPQAKVYLVAGDDIADRRFPNVDAVLRRPVDWAGLLAERGVGL